MNFSQVEGGIPSGGSPLGLNADSSPVVFAPNAHGELLGSDSGVCLAVRGYGSPSAGSFKQGIQFHYLASSTGRLYLKTNKIRRHGGTLLTKRLLSTLSRRDNVLLNMTASKSVRREKLSMCCT